MPLLSRRQTFAKNLTVTSPFVIFSLSFQKIAFLTQNDENRFFSDIILKRSQVLKSRINTCALNTSLHSSHRLVPLLRRLSQPNQTLNRIGGVLLCLSYHTLG